MKIKKEILIGTAVAGAGGAIGSAARACFLATEIYTPMVLILLTNVIGSFLFGFFMRMLQRRYTLDRRFTDFLLTGVCGGLTTFSTVMAFSGTESREDFLIYFILMSVLAMFGVVFGAWLANNKIG